MARFILLFLFLAIMNPLNAAQTEKSGLRGDREAIEAARAMVETMGGLEIWSQIQSVHFVHDWFPVHRPDVYREDEILDLTGPRSWVEMRSEIYHRLRAYSPEHRFWNMVNGEFSFDTDERFDNAMARAPFNLYRMMRGVARDDPYYEVKLSEGDIPGSRQLQFSGPDGQPGGYVILNARNEPRVWATNQYRYIFGPLKRFGSVRLPDWAVYGNGGTMYQMVSFTASRERPDVAIFAPPSDRD